MAKPLGGGAPKPPRGEVAVIGYRVDQSHGSFMFCLLDDWIKNCLRVNQELALKKLISQYPKGANVIHLPPAQTSRALSVTALRTTPRLRVSECTKLG